MKKVGKLRPLRNLSTANITNPFTNGVAIPVTKTFVVDIIMVQTRPYRSDIHPKNNVPIMAPAKEIDCDV